MRPRVRPLHGLREAREAEVAHLQRRHHDVPALLGAGTSAVGDLGITTIADAQRLRITDVTTVGTGVDANVRITMAPTTTGRGAPQEGQD